MKIYKLFMASGYLLLVAAAIGFVFQYQWYLLGGFIGSLICMSTAAILLEIDEGFERVMNRDNLWNLKRVVKDSPKNYRFDKKK